MDTDLENNYDEIVMMGISGGGWSTTMYAALLPKIKKAYSFYGGELPKIFKIHQFKHKHFETDHSKIYDEYDMLDFWFLNH